MNAFLYLLGAVACICWRWMQWLAAQPAGTSLKAFWRARLATNVSSMIVSVLMMGAYLTGAMGIFLRTLIPDAVDAQIPPMYTEAWFAPIAGFGLTFGARVLVKKFSEKIGVKEDE